MVHSTKTLSTDATSSGDIQTAQGASDVLTDILRSGAQKMLKAAVGQVAIYRKGVTSKPNAEDMSRFIKQAKTIMRLLTA